MAVAEEHVEKYKHNKEFATEEIHDADKYGDWFIVALFYAGLHLIDAELAGYKLSPSDHKDRNFQVRQPELFSKAVRDDYLALYSLSQKARYACVAISSKDTYNAQMHLESIESELQSGSCP